MQLTNAPHAPPLALALVLVAVRFLAIALALVQMRLTQVQALVDVPLPPLPHKSHHIGCCYAMQRYGPSWRGEEGEHLRGHGQVGVVQWRTPGDKIRMGTRARLEGIVAVGIVKE